VALMTPNKPTVVLSQPPVNVDHGLPKLAGVIQRLHRTGRGASHNASASIAPAGSKVGVT
jgi:hypothetical protein